MSSEDFTQYEEFMREGKKLAAEGKLYESLSKFEYARKIQPTPKVLQRIQKLKDFIRQNKSSKSKFTSENGVDDSKRSESLAEPSVSRLSVPVHGKPHKSAEDYFEPAPKPSEVLHEIQNVEVMKPPANVNDLTPEQLAKFNDLKKKAMRFSYEGKFEFALEFFQQAYKLRNCPIVKKYIDEMKILIAKHSKELKDFQELAVTGKKLALEGKPAEALGKLRDAFEICPSPKVSRVMKFLEGGKESTSGKLYTEKDPMADFVTSKTKTPSPESTYPSIISDISRNITYSDSGKQSTPTDPSLLSPENLSTFKSLYKRAREEASEGRLQVALKLLNKACSICKTEKISNRIKDLKEHIKMSEKDEEEDDKMVEVAEGFQIYHEIYEKLYPYQRLGVAWMWKLFKKQKGGVLGDDMGLGKTFQVIAFLSGLIDAELVKHVLIIMPVSLLTNWENEFKKWCPGIKVYLFHGTSKKEREKNALRVQRKGHVLLTSYGMVVNNLNYLDKAEGSRFIWDYVILDEGHKIKNPNKTTKAVQELPAKNRLVLTGTPIQNNLRELWALYDFVQQGALLGSMKTFKMQYENIITRAREKDATVGEKRLGTEMAENLKTLIQPYFFRRSKAEIWGDNGSKPDVGDIEGKMADLKISENNKLTTRKNDLIIWLTMSDQQCEIYRSFLHSETVKLTLVSKRSPLVELTTLKKICDHPRLLSQRACLQLGLNGELAEEDLLRELDNEANMASSIENVSDETLIKESGKIKFLISLLANLKQNGHRTLVFSLSRKILDMVHRILTNRGWNVLRVDGTITNMEERERRIQLFQRNDSYSVFLLTTQVGGVGITLTAADRVVIYDPSWNPATDAQAVDRAYRIGQKKDVVVYRLMTCGTVEEKIYRRQIFKDSITKQATGAADPYRYFSKQELRELFILEDSNYSATQVQLSQMHSGERKTDVSLDEHIAFLHSLDIFGISDHDLMFSKNIQDDTEDNDESAISHGYIKKQVAAAQQLIQAEAAVVEDGLRIAGNYTRPYLENIPTFKKNTEKDLYKAPALPEVVDLTGYSPDFKRFRSSTYVNSEENYISLFSPVKGKSPITMNSPEEVKPKRPSLKYQPLTLEKNKITHFFTTSDNKTKAIDVSKSMTAEMYNSPDRQSSAHRTNDEYIECNSEQRMSNVVKEVDVNPFQSIEVNNEDLKLNSTIDIECDETTFSTQSGQPNISENIISPYQTVAELDGLKTSVDDLNESDSKLPESDSELDQIAEPSSSIQDMVTMEKYSTEPLHSAGNIACGDEIAPCLNAKQDLDDALAVDCDPEPSAEKVDVLEYISNIGDFRQRQDRANSMPGPSTQVSIKDLKARLSYSSYDAQKPLQPEDNDSVRIDEDSIVEEACGNTHMSPKVQEDSFEKNESNIDMSGSFVQPSATSETKLSRSSWLAANHLDTSRLSHLDAEDIKPYQSMRLSEENRKQSLAGGEIPSMSQHLSMFLNESIGDLSFNNPMSMKKKRTSCAKPYQHLSESDSSQPASHSSSANTSFEFIVSGSEDESGSDCSENSAASPSLNESVTFVPSSIPSTPVAKTPLDKSCRAFSSPSSPRRITPLRLHKSYRSPSNSPFAKAMASSPLLQAVKMDTTLVDPDDSNADSPIQSRKKRVNAIVSESEESADEAASISLDKKWHSSDEDLSMDISSSQFKTPKSRAHSVNDASYMSYRSAESDYSDESLSD